MPLIPPPPPVSPEEFERRWKAGARSVRELDPAFAKWQDQCNATTTIGWAVVVAGAVVMLIVIVAVICFGR